MHLLKNKKVGNLFISFYYDSVTALQAGRSQVQFPMVSLEFFTDIFLPAALWPWG